MKADSDASESSQTLSLLRDLQHLRGVPCKDCLSPLCGHEALMSIVMGFQDAPFCLTCLAAGLGERTEGLRDRLTEYIQRKDCFRQGWLWANQEEGFSSDGKPPCLWGGKNNGDPRMIEKSDSPFPTNSDRPAANVEWDAGDMGCGDLVLELRLRLMALKPGEVLKLTARDPGAPEDIPAWCGLTGHHLVLARQPVYWIQRKEN